MTYTTDELKSILVKNTEWLNGIESGIRADLRGADLRRADLSDANLSCADLSDANLSCANLRRADLRDADLRGANLSDANLSDANLSDADLSDADLRGADLRRANLRGADLILIGQDIRGYLFLGHKNNDGTLVICAGCRKFIGMSDARAHWNERHLNDAILHEDILSLLDRAERMAKARGWTV